MKKIISLALLGIFLGLTGFSQNNPAYWTELEFSKKIIKNLKVEFNPELRLRNDFNLDSYILEGGLSYKLHKYLTIAAYYRFENENNYREKRQIYEWESSNRLAFDAKSGIDIKRFGFQARVRYSNGSDFDDTTDDKASYFRYKLKAGYDIKGSKFRPFASAELFHDLILNDVDKVRYSGGLAYPINKYNEVNAFYMIQDYSDDKSSLKVVGLGYSLKF